MTEFHPATDRTESTSTAESTPATLQLDTIVTCLEQIRTRLWLVRLLERCALGAACGGVLCAIFLLGRYLQWRYPGWAIALDALPLVAIAALWLANRKFAAVWSRTTLVAAGLAALFSIAAMTQVMTGLYAEALTAHVWLIPAIVLGAYGLAALLSVRRVSPRAAAIFVDRRGGLQEQVATAYEWAHQKSPINDVAESFRAPLLESAAAACRRVHVAKIGYARLNRKMYGLTALALAAAAAALWLEPLPALARRAARPNPLVVQQAQDLAKALAALEKEKKLDTDSTENKAIAPLAATVKELRENPNMSNLEALDKLDKARDALQETKDKQDAAEKAAGTLAGGDLTSRIAQAAQAVKDAQMKAAAGDPAAGSMKASAESAMAQAAADAGAKLSSMSGSDQKQVASALKTAANQAGGDSKLQSSLQDAAHAAENGDSKKLSQALADAGNRMGSQQGDKALSGDDLQKAMDQIRDAEEKMGGGSQMAGSSGGGEQPQSGNQPQSGSQGGGNQGDQTAQAGDKEGGSGQQQQQPGEGQGDKQGQGQAGAGKEGSGQQMGKGSGGQGTAQGENTDSGSTNMETPGGPGEHFHNGVIGKEGTFVRVYAPNAVENKGEREKADAKLDLRSPSAGTIQIMGMGDKTDGPLVDYASQVPAARKLAENALDKQQIPPQYRDLIRDYYAH